MLLTWFERSAAVCRDLWVVSLLVRVLRRFLLQRMALAAEPLPTNTKEDSPPNKLKGILTSLFKKSHGIQVAYGDLTSPKTSTAYVSADTGPAFAAGRSAALHAPAGSVQLTSASGPHRHAAAQQLEPQQHEQQGGSPPAADHAAAEYKSISISKSISDVAAQTAAELCRSSAATNTARDYVLSDPGLPPYQQQQQCRQTQAQQQRTPPQQQQQQQMLQLYGPAAAATAAAGVSAAVPAMPAMPLLLIGQRSSSGSIKEPGASVWLHEAYSSPHSPAAASPSSLQRSSTGLRGSSTMSSGGKLHGSMEDMYDLIFGSCPAPAASNAGSPCPAAPKPTRHEPTAYLGSSPCLIQPQQQHLLQTYCSVGAAPEAASGHRTDMPGRGSGSGGAAAGGSSSGRVGGYCQLDDLVPAGLPKLKISGRHRRCSDSDSAAAASFFIDVSAGCGSSSGGGGGVTGCGCPAVSGLQAAAAAAGDRAGGSPRYGLPACGNPLSHAPAAQQPPSSSNSSSSAKRLWDRRQVALNSSSSGSRSAAGSPCGSAPAGPGAWRTRGCPGGPAGLAQNAVRLNFDAACASADDGDATPAYAAGSSICSETPLSHSHSNPELCVAAPVGAAAPACARSLFGSMPQLDRHLLPGACGGSGHATSGSGGWLARADSGLFGLDAGDQLSAASDDEFIREINSENPLSSAWGPAHAKLMGFKYCDATSPLNHPGRASPFKSSPYSSPRGASRDTSMFDLPLRAAAAAVSCPGSPLANLHNNNNSSSSSSTFDDAALQQRHRHPFGRCTHDAATCYRPSPLQQKQQRGDDSQRSQQHRGRSSNGEVAVSRSGSREHVQGESGSLLLSRPSSSEPTESTTAAAAAAAAARRSSGQLASADASEAADGPGVSRCQVLQRGTPCSSSTGFSLMGEGRQQSEAAATADASEQAQHSAPGSCSTHSRQQNLSSSNSFGRCGAPPAAAVSALMAGWGGVPAVAASSSPMQRQRYGVRQQAGGRTAAAAGVPRLVLGGSGGSSSCSSAAPAAVHDMPGSTRPTVASSSAAAAVAGRPNPGRQLQRMEADSDAKVNSSSSNRSSSSSSVALLRSSSMPMPGAVGRSGSTAGSSPGPGSCAAPSPGGTLSQLASAATAAADSIRAALAGGISSSGLLSGVACSPELLLVQPPAVPGGDSSAGRRLTRRHSRGLSSGSFSHPSRLSQSSAIGEPGVELSAGAAGVAGARLSGRASSSSSSCGLLGVLSLELTAAGVCAEDAAVDSSRGGVELRQQAAQQQAQQQQQQQQQERQELLREQELGAQQSGRLAEGTGMAVAEAAAATAEGSDAVLTRQDSGSSSEADNALESDAMGSRYSITSSDVSPSQQQCSSLVDSPQQQQQQQLAAMPSLPEVDFIERIGRGSFGEVYRGVWCGSVVAVKVIRVRQQPPAARHTAHRGPAIAVAASVAGLSLKDGSSYTSNLQQQQQQQQQCELEAADGEQQQQQQQDVHEQQVAMELAQHEYESWLNANLRHPNIVQLFTSFTVVLEDRLPQLLAAGGAAAGGAGACCVHEGVGWAAGLSWKTHLVMEFCELGTMQGVLQRGGFLDPLASGRCNALWVLCTAKELCAALAYLHSMDVVHGDLKSSNVLLKAAATTAWDSRGFVAKVSDFGLSRVMDAISAANGTAATAASSSCGDPSSAVAAAAAGNASPGVPLGQWPVQAQQFGALSHAAPELMRGGELSKASDVYSVGVLLWELLTGQAPFHGMHPGQLLNAKLTHPTSQLLPLPDSAPPALAGLCLGCWAEEPGQRPSMQGVIEQLNCMALELLGEDQALLAFPDLARHVMAQRRSAAAAGVV
ncbi:hypothetical protein COO60DRAFT_383790 [Scenedesmus sp. NREL 46B-D3]|nr:hypothetical protein COO60DRAFT_383790 [Scenedesmus sp. NREL 46B-D3]